MKAYRLTQWQRPAEFSDVDVREPGAGEVLVQVGGAGVCHSDLHVMVELFAPEQAPQVYEWLRAGTIRGRAVITHNADLESSSRQSAVNSR